MLVLSSVHVHQNPESRRAVGHQECVHHHCHGHLVQLVPSIQDCVLCQFLTLPMLTAAVAALIIYSHRVSKTPIAWRQHVVYDDACGIPPLRAPPAV